ncbi:hypothetical protein GCM10010910_11390 [Microbacterium nanhaiense]|uniref:Uncharacterized protein n=1 Tax=Microbacterium nanhaiense TaxID=1301026 RepID=A0ABQ2MZC8_9MICO|nr:hypothetical protein [Microbacterium nanhaiense]GGO62100.1 hypothetical protein GCM10010910_11390 [Microbacterium nanhaiense]
MTQSMGKAPQERGGIVGRVARSQGLLLPWCISLVLAIAVEIFAPPSHRWDGYAAAAGVAVIITFLVQVTIARADGFILRTSTSALGSVLIIGIVSFVGALFAASGAGLSLFPSDFGAS